MILTPPVKKFGRAPKLRAALKGVLDHVFRAGKGVAQSLFCHRPQKFKRGG